MSKIFDNSDEFKRRLDSAVQQPHTLADTLSDEFMQRYTKCASASEMFAKIRVDEGVEESVGLTLAQMNTGTLRYSSFSSWPLMMATAHGEWLKRQIKQ